MERRSYAELALLTLKGMAMGAADVVPGVSGGTIAFISGIYQELIDSINRINLDALKILRREGIGVFWKHINGTFFLFLFSGVIISIASLAKVVTYLLTNFPVLIWSFFFGLILASVWLVGKKISKWSASTVLMMLLGVVVAYYITTIQTVGSNHSNGFIFLSGAIAICAMILPGISGSFILVLLGSYYTVLEAIKDRDMLIIGLFGAGCLVGLLSFARVLKFLFARFESMTVALLTGFMLGSLNKVWPWKENVGENPVLVHSDGREDWLTVNVFPTQYEGESFLLWSLVCAVTGFAIILVLERFAPKENG